MKLLMINQDWFAAEWRAAGHEVVTAGMNPGVDIRFSTPLIPVLDIAKDFTPDAVVVHDNSSPIMVSGIEDLSIPAVFYSVDAHHHAHYHKFLAGAFDLTFVAQKDYLPQYLEQGAAAEWLPLWASRIVEASGEKRYGAVFVGTMDPALNPDRVAFFEALQKRVPLVIERGEYWKIFPHAEIVVNQTVKGDLNFRVFEAMMCGSMLLTEASGNGLEDLFTPGTHLVTYTKGLADEAAGMIQTYLGDLEKCRAIAAAGRAEIVAKHQPQHRAALVMDRIQKLSAGSAPRRYLGMMVNYAVLSTVFEELDRGLVAEALLRGLRCIELALARGEPMAHDLGYYAVLCAIRYDQLAAGRQGAGLLRKLHAASPGSPVVSLGIIRDYLNHGERAQAEQMAGVFSAGVEEVFALSERLVADLLARTK